MPEKSIEIVAHRIRLVIRAASALLIRPDETEFAPDNRTIWRKNSLIQISKTLSKMSER